MEVIPVLRLFPDVPVFHSRECTIREDNLAVNAVIAISGNQTKPLKPLPELSFSAVSATQDCALLKELYDRAIMSDTDIFEGFDVQRFILGLKMPNVPRSTRIRALQLVLVIIQESEEAAVTLLRLGFLEIIEQIIGKDSESTELCVDCLFEVSAQEVPEVKLYLGKSINLIGHSLLMSNDICVIERALSALAFLNATYGEVSEFIARSLVPTILVNLLKHPDEHVSRLTLSILVPLCIEFSAAADQVIASGAYRHLDRFLCDTDKNPQVCASKFLYVMLSRTIERKICL